MTHPMWSGFPPAGSQLPMGTPVPKKEREENDWELYAEAIQSWRCWRVVESGDALLLQSITYKVNWTPRQEMVAECRANVSPFRVDITPEHTAPDIDHQCGIYSLKSPDDALTWVRRSLPAETIVYGKSFIWGHCFKFTKGYLSEFAYPSLLYVPPTAFERGSSTKLEIEASELAPILSETYRVEAIAE